MRRAEKADNFSLFETALGWGGVAASSAGVAGVYLPFGGRSRDEALAAISSSYGTLAEGGKTADLAAAKLSAYFNGEKANFDLPLDCSEFTGFQMLVYDYVRSIPYGAVRSYSEVAREIGRPTAARGVGAAMAVNPMPIIIPCHRVVGKSGKLTGYSAEGGIDSKRWLLKMEGYLCA